MRAPTGAQAFTARSNDRNSNLAVLGGVQGDKFPRPDFSRWAAYKAEPNTAKPLLRKEPVKTAVVAEPEDAGEKISVPESIALLVEALPKRSQFTGCVSNLGPYINADEILQILLQSSIAVPQVAPKMVSIYLYEQNKKRGGRWEDGTLLIQDALQNIANKSKIRHNFPCSRSLITPSACAISL
jgi:hypothetical protein